MVAKHPSTAKFICKRLYLYFVSETENWDEINKLSEVFLKNDGEIKKVLEAMFKSEHFKSGDIRFKKVKSPSDLVFGISRLVDKYKIPDLDSAELAINTLLMGQFLMNPPSVEGWHEGEEWIDSGSLIERINYASTEISNTSSYGVKRIIEIKDNSHITVKQNYIDGQIRLVAYSMFNDVFDGHKAEFTIKNGANISLNDIEVIVGDIFGNSIDVYYNETDNHNYDYSFNPHDKQSYLQRLN